MPDFMPHDGYTATTMEVRLPTARTPFYQYVVGWDGPNAMSGLVIGVGNAIGDAVTDASNQFDALVPGPPLDNPENPVLP